MKLKKVFLLTVVVLIVFWFVCAGIIAFFGKSMLSAQLSKALNSSVTIEKVGFSFPSTISIHGITVGTCAQIKTIQLSPNLLSILTGKIVLNELKLVNPRITIEVSPDGKLNLPILEQNGQAPQIFMLSLLLTDGSISLVDKKVTTDGFKVSVEEINLSVKKVAFPITSLKTDFSASALLKDVQGKGVGLLSGSGWVDWGKKSSDVLLSIQDLDVPYFSVYFTEYLPKKKMTNAKLGLELTLKGQDNVLDISTKVGLKNIQYAKQSESEQQGVNVPDVLSTSMNLFSDAGGDMNFEFNMRTKFDKPAISINDLKRAVFEAALNNLSRQRPDQVIQKVGSAVEEFKQFGQTFKELFSKPKEQNSEVKQAESVQPAVESVSQASLSTQTQTIGNQSEVVQAQTNTSSAIVEQASVEQTPVEQAPVAVSVGNVSAAGVQTTVDAISVVVNETVGSNVSEVNQTQSQ